MRYMFLLLIIVATVVTARTPNYDESKVAPYKLEDPLVFADGTKLTSPEQWPTRRKEILDIFQSQMFGRMPPPSPVTLEVIEQGETLAGFAIRKQVRMWFKPDKTGPKIDWLLLIPKYAKAPSPVIIFLNYRGNQELLPDKEIVIPDCWLRNGTDEKVAEHLVTPETRGALSNPNCDSPVPAGMLIAHGYAIATACYGEISPDPDKPEDQDKLAYTGVFTLWPPRDPARDDNTTSIGAWAWGLMRGLDMLEREPAVNAKKVVLTGYSRLGKAALVAGAFDDRFPFVCPNETGGGGAPLAKRDFGENVSTEMKMFTHWYCKAYGKYVDNEAAMPFDQHLLLAAVAPRRLLIEGYDKPWFDTKGEWLACRAASPVWTFLGKQGLPDVSFPDDLDTSAIGSSIGYVRRPGPHGISYHDWMWMMDAADATFGK